MATMKLKAGEEVVAYFCPDGEKPSQERMTIKGFSVLGIYFESGDWWHWATERSWYGFGYHKDGHVLYVRHSWQIPYACVFEKVRLGKYSDLQFAPIKYLWTLCFGGKDGKEVYNICSVAVTGLGEKGQYTKMGIDELRRLSKEIVPPDFHGNCFEQQDQLIEYSKLLRSKLNKGIFNYL